MTSSLGANKMLSRLGDLRKALNALGNLDQEAGSLVPAASLPELVAVGQRLWWLIKKADKALDVIKDRLRTESGGISKKFESGEGSHCMVTYSAPKVTLRKDAEIPKLKAVLGAKFLDLFEESIKYKPRKDFQEAFKECSPEEMAVLLTAVDMTSDPPRISFKD